MLNSDLFLLFSLWLDMKWCSLHHDFHTQLHSSVIPSWGTMLKLSGKQALILWNYMQKCLSAVASSTQYVLTPVHRFEGCKQSDERTWHLRLSVCFISSLLFPPLCLARCARPECNTLLYRETMGRQPRCQNKFILPSVWSKPLDMCVPVYTVCEAS